MQHNMSSPLWSPVSDAGVRIWQTKGRKPAAGGFTLGVRYPNQPHTPPPFYEILGASPTVRHSSGLPPIGHSRATGNSAQGCLLVGNSAQGCLPAIKRSNRVCVPESWRRQHPFVDVYGRSLAGLFEA